MDIAGDSSGCGICVELVTEHVHAVMAGTLAQIGRIAAAVTA
ncbi:hypothetical protein ACFYZB_45740 [Streptomyces sp. NPDC001852]